MARILNQQKNVGMFRFNVAEIAVTVQPEHARNLLIRPFLEQTDGPADRGGGVAQGGDGVPAVVLAVTVCALAAMMPCR